MDIVIPYKLNGDATELRYALRSIEKYLKGWHTVLLVGEFPTWYNGAGVDYPDTTNRKQFNLMQKLFKAANNDWPSERFIYWHDDHFLLKELHVNDIKNWHHNTMSDALGKANGKYYTAVKNTIDILGDNLPYYDIHVPCVFEKEGIKRMNKLNWEKEYVIKSTYFNLVWPNGNYEPMTDCKINRELTKSEIEERIKDRLFFSTGPNGVKSAMIKKLNELYPEPSKYETL